MRSIHFLPVFQTAIIEFNSEEERQEETNKLRQIMIRKAQIKIENEQWHDQIDDLVYLNETYKTLIIHITIQGKKENISLDNIIRMLRDGKNAMKHAYTLRHESTQYLHLGKNKVANVAPIQNLVGLIINSLAIECKITVDLNRTRLQSKDIALCAVFEKFLIDTITSDKYQRSLRPFEIDGLTAKSENVIRKIRLQQTQLSERVLQLETANNELCKAHEAAHQEAQSWQEKFEKLQEQLQVKLLETRLPLETRIKELESNNEEFSKEVKKLNSELDDKNSTITLLTKKIQKLKNELDDIDKKIESLSPQKEKAPSPFMFGKRY